MLGWNMSDILHFLYSRLTDFSNNFSAINDEQSEHFHQGLKVMEA